MLLHALPAAPPRRSCRAPALCLAAFALLTRSAAAAAAAAPAAAPWEEHFLTSTPAALLAAATAATNATAGAVPPVTVLFSEVRLSYDAAGRLTTTRRVVYRCNRADLDAAWSEVAQPWAPWYQDAPRVRARVVTADGVEHPFDPRTLAASPIGDAAADADGGARLLHAPLPAVAAGSVVEEERVVADAAPLFARGTVVRCRLGGGAPIRTLRVVVEAPAAMPLRYALRQLPAAPPRRETPAGRTRLTFELRDLPAAPPPPPGLPPEAPRWPEIEVATAAAWADVAADYSRTVEAAGAGAGDALEAWLTAAGARGEAGSQLELIERVLVGMAALRPTGVELGAAALAPRPPAETLRRGTADAKDAAALLVAALKAMEIPAYVALLSAGEERRDADPALPGMGAFNHAVVYVPGTPPVWIDPSTPWARAGELPPGDQGREALVAAPGVTALLRTPAAAAADNRITITRAVTLADSGAAGLVETVQFQGEVEAAKRAFFAATPEPEVRRQLDEHVRAVFGAKAAGAIEHGDPRDLTRPFWLRVAAPAVAVGATTEAAAGVSLPYAALVEMLPETLFHPDDAGAGSPAREVDFWFARPHVVELHYHVTVPAGFAAVELPASRARQLGTMVLSEDYAAAAQGGVDATLRLDTGRRRIDARELAAVRTALAALLAEGRQTLRFQQVGEAAAAAGHIPEALAEFRQEAAAAPAKALPHQRLARALLAAGMGDAARREAELAVHLDGVSVAAWFTLGWVWQHDAIGRPYSPGFDRARALEALRHAVELAPGLVGPRADRAILLEYDASGVRYAPGADLPAAIAAYRALQQDLHEHSFDESLLRDLLYADRADEALDLAGRLADSPVTRLAIVAATARRQGPDAALREAKRRVPEAARRLELLELAASALVRLHDFRGAAAMLERAGALAPDPATLAAQAAVMRAARPAGDIGLPPAEPASVARRALLLLAGGDAADPGPFLELFRRGAPAARSPGAGPAPDLPPALRAALERTLRQAQAGRGPAAGAAGLPPDLRAALAFAARAESVSGDDQLGYHVAYRARVGGSTAGGEDFYVVRDAAGGYRLAALGQQPALLGQEAQRRLAAGDLRGARQWLDWAREITPDAAGEPPRPAFAALWTRGAGGDEQQVRCAAAVLAGPGPGDDGAALAVERACRAAAADAPRQQIFDVALAETAAAAERWDALGEAAGRLAAAHPDDVPSFLLAARALSGRQRDRDLAALAGERLQRLPGDRAATLELAAVERRQGDFGAAERRLRQLAQAPGAGADDLAGLAWLLAARGDSGEPALDLAQRAVRRAETAGALRALAAALVEHGRLADSYQALVAAVAAGDGGDTPGAADWYLLGRIAERCGLPGDARTLYEKVEKAEPLDPVSPWRLAQARLTALLGRSSVNR